MKINWQPYRAGMSERLCWSGDTGTTYTVYLVPAYDNKCWRAHLYMTSEPYIPLNIGDIPCDVTELAMALAEKAARIYIEDKLKITL